MGLKAATIVPSCVLGCLLALSAGCVSAQALSASSPAAIAQPASDIMNDVFIGKGSKGPYLLSWKNVQIGGETVIVSARRLGAGRDYAIDYASGAVAFSEPLGKNAIARVTYKILPGKSAPNTGAVNLPFSMRLLATGRGTLDVTGFYRDPGANTPSQGVLGVGGGLKLGPRSDFSSTFLVSQNDDGTGRAAPGLSERSAMKLGTAASVGSLSLRASFVRAGGQFPGAKDYGFQPGRQLLDLSTAYGRTSDVIYASFSYRQQENLGAAQKEAAQVTTEGKIALKVAAGSKLTLARSGTENLGPAGSMAASSANSAQLEQRLGTKTTATALVQRSESGAAAARDAADTTRFTFQSSAIDSIKLQGDWARNQSRNSGGETSLGVGVNAAVGKRTRADASYSSVESDKNGQQTRMNVKLEANPLSRVDIAADYSSQYGTGVGQTAAGVRLAARPFDGLRVEATASEKQPLLGPDEQKRTVRVEAEPAGFIKLSAGRSEREIGTTEQASVDARVEIAPSSRLRLSTSYAASADEQRTWTVRDYSGTVRPVTGLELSGGYRNREFAGPGDLDSTTVRVALEQWRSFSMKGQYVSNPEGTNGSVQMLTTKSLGAALKLGVVALSGAYTTRDEYLLARSSREAELGLSIGVFGRGLLSTGYKLASSSAAREQATEVYSIGYTHIVGSSFNLSLSGELQRRGAFSPDPMQEYKAAAKLGISF